MNPKKIIEALIPHKLNHNPLKSTKSIVSVKYNAKKLELILESNLFYSIKTTVEYISPNEFAIENSIFLDMKFLEKVLRNCIGEEIIFAMSPQKNDNEITISSGHIRYFLKNEDQALTSNSKDKINNIYTFEATMMFEMLIKDFVGVAKKAARFASKDKYRKNLQSVCVRQFKDRLKFASTDGRTICEIEYIAKQAQFEPDKESDKDYIEATIPTKVINLIKKSNRGFVFFIQSEENSIISIPNMDIAWKRDPEKFPNYERVFDGNPMPKTKTQIKREQTMNALKTSMIYGKNDGYFCAIKLNHKINNGIECDSSISIAGYDSKSHDGNSFLYTNRIDFDSEYLRNIYQSEADFLNHEYSKSVFLSSKYLHDILKAIDSFHFLLFVKNGLTPEPIIVKPSESIENINERYLLMPLRNSENRFA